MKTTEELLSSIRKKATEIITERQNLLSQMSELSNRIIELNQIINQQKEHISQLENMQFVQSFTGIIPQETQKETRKRLTELLKEIDKCIEIVND